MATEPMGESIDWFERLTGFREASYHHTQERLAVRQGRLLHADGRQTWGMGQLQIPTLAELRARVGAPVQEDSLCVSIVRGNVQDLHSDSANCRALFQAASQFNLLEMVSERVSPEHGVTRYRHDATQGPACAIAAGAGTIFRNYLVGFPEGRGQTSRRQIDCLADLGAAMGNTRGELWTMSNGYLMVRPQALQTIDRILRDASQSQLEAWRDLLRIGVHWNVQVTLPGVGGHQYVSQAYCSALPIAYQSAGPASLWERFASLVLEGAYEATLLAGALNQAEHGSRVVFLTSVGGGVFGNHPAWIANAVRRALDRCRHFPLDVRIVALSSPAAEMLKTVQDFEEG